MVQQPDKAEEGTLTRISRDVKKRVRVSVYFGDKDPVTRQWVWEHPGVAAKLMKEWLAQQVHGGALGEAVVPPGVAAERLPAVPEKRKAAQDLAIPSQEAARPTALGDAAGRGGNSDPSAGPAWRSDILGILKQAKADQKQ